MSLLNDNGRRKGITWHSSDETKKLLVCEYVKGNSREMEVKRITLIVIEVIPEIVKKKLRWRGQKYVEIKDKSFEKWKSRKWRNDCWTEM